MKKLLVLLIVLMSLSLVGCSSNKPQVESKEDVIEEVKDITVPEFTVKICGAKITNNDLENYPLFKITTHSVNSSGTEHNTEYVGYRLKDLLDIAQVTGDLNKATIICTDGYEMTYEGDLTADNVLIAITKDGEIFKEAPWFAPCASETTGDYAQDLAKIEINDFTSPLAGGGKEENSEEKEEIVFPQEPVSEDKTDKITFGDFCFKINGVEVTNANLEGLKIFRNTVTTKNSKEVVSQSKYSGYVLKDVLEKLNISGTKVKAIALDGYENELAEEYVLDELTIIAIEKDKEVGKDGTVWLAPCRDSASGSYAREVVELIVE